MTPRVLNVGGGSKKIVLPPHYDGWEHHLLDIDPAGQPDFTCDAREMASLPAASYDAIWCSHNLEHYWRHDLPRVLAGFTHVLKEHGYAEIRVPDMRAVFEEMLKKGMDIDDVLYESSVGPITINDVIYGYGAQIEKSGLDFYAHKNGFTPNTLGEALKKAGFNGIFIGAGAGTFELVALAFLNGPTDEQASRFGIR